MFTSSQVSALSAVLILAAAVRGDTGCDLTTVYKGASQFLTSLSEHASSLFDGKDSLAGMTVFVPTDKFLDDSGITMFSRGAFQGENALPVMRRHVFAADPFADAALADGAAVRNHNGGLFITQSRAFASPTNLRISAAGQPHEQGALLHRVGLQACGGGVTVHIIDRLLPQPTGEINGILYTDMERPLPFDPPQCTSLLQAMRHIKGSGTLLASTRIHDLHDMVQPSSGEEASFTVFMPTDDAFNSFETFDPDMYARIMNDPDLWRQMASLHVAKSQWAEDDGPAEMQLTTLAWCDTAPCMLSASMDDEGQAFVRPVRGEAPEAQAALKGVPFCHGIIYTIDEVLRIDDVETAADAEAAAGQEDVGEAGAVAEAPAVEYGAVDDYEDDAVDDYEDVALAPRAVLAPKGGEWVDYAAADAEDRGLNDHAGAGGDYAEADGPAEEYVDDEADAGDYEYAAASAPADAAEYEDDSEEYSAAAGDYEADDAGDGVDYEAEEDAEDVGDYTAGGEDYEGLIDPGTVIPTKEEWQERE